MLKIDHDGETVDLVSGPGSAQELLTAENVSLRLLLTQAKLSAETLLAQAGSTPRSAKPPTSCKS